MRRIFFLIFLIFLAVNLSSFAKSQAALIKIQGAIVPSTQDFIHRQFQNANNQHDQMIILQIDTPGGLSESMRGINQDILSSPIPVITYVAPSGARAASAGTYIIYASHIAAMAPGTNIGAATPVSIGMLGGEENNKEKPKSPEEIKTINDAKAYIRVWPNYALGIRHGQSKP